ncbi:hypothetical protein B0A53_01874 [Rhodotorula sp. CCFEE 5036]|nr:hypothetical protein B0A53_01874 [Rhodotorula sp. CCFEE 5036]
MPSSGAASLPHHATNRSVDDDDDGAWDEASDDERGGGGDGDAATLSARLGAISLKPRGATTVSPIQTTNLDKPLAGDHKKSPSSAATSASTWSFNPFSMRPSARPSHASTSSSLFGGPFSSTITAASSTSTSPPSNSIPTPSALYAYPRAATSTSSSFTTTTMGNTPPTSPSRHTSSTASTAPIVSPSLGAEAVAAALSGRLSLPLHHHHHGGVGVALRSSSTPAPAASNAAAGAATDPPPRPTRGASYLAGASRVQAEADRCVSEQEEQKKRRESSSNSAGASGGESAAAGREQAQSGQGSSSGSRRRSGSSSTTGGGDGGNGSDDKELGKGDGYAKEQYRRAVRQDVADLVRDPAHVLARLKVAWRPRPPPSPRVQPTTSSSPAQQPGRSDGSVPTETVAGGPYSSSSESPLRPQAAAHDPDPEAEDDGDDDGVDGPLAGVNSSSTGGYVNLNAPSISSREATLLAGIHSPETVVVPADPEEEGEKGRENRRKRKFLQVLEGGEQQGGGAGAGGENVDLAELRKLAWSGVPNELRPMVWQLLLGYLPAPTARRAATLARKRSEYASLVKQAFSRGVKGLDGPLWHQISIDVPRTRPGVPLWQAEATQRSLERVLYVWAIRHPASGYVQGINDLVTPFFQVFLASYIDADPETFDVSVLAPEVLEALEADSFWCLSKLLDGIQDNYIFAQPGIQRLVKKMETLCGRVDAPLAAHLKEQGVEFIQFAFRWMNCLLMRELSVKNIVRMWDTYLAEGGDAFSEFHLYVCLAFLVRWSDQLREMDFQSIIMFLQSLPTQNWETAHEVGVLCVAIKEHGSRNPQTGRYEAPYGVIFEKTAHLLEALNGTLRAAKRQKKVTFEGELLMMPKDAKVPLVLLEDSPDSVDKKADATLP